MTKSSAVKKEFKKAVVVSLVVVATLLVTTFGLAVFQALAAAEEAAAGGATVYTDPDIVRWAFLSAAIVAGIGALAAGFAVAYVGAAAMGAIGEKPELAGRAIAFVGLAEGVAIFPLVIAIMILVKI